MAPKVFDLAAQVCKLAALVALVAVVITAAQDAMPWWLPRAAFAFAVVYAILFVASRATRRDGGSAG